MVALYDTEPRILSRRGVHVRLQPGQHHSHVRPNRRGVHPGVCDDGSCQRAQHAHRRAPLIARDAPPHPMRRRMPYAQASPVPAPMTADAR